MRLKRSARGLSIKRLTPLAFLALVAFFPQACARAKRTPPDATYSFSHDNPAYLLLIEGRLQAAAMMPTLAPQAQASARAVSALISADTPEGNKAYVAANGVGIIPLVVDSASGVISVMPAIATRYFAGRVFGSLGLKGDTLACLLYVDDMASSSAPDVAGIPGTIMGTAPDSSPAGESEARGSSFILIPIKGEHPREFKLLSGSLRLERLFALFPSSPDAWFVQTRTIQDSSVISAYYRCDPRSGQARPVSREEFERGSMRPEFALPETLRKATSGRSSAVSVLAADGSRFMTRAGSGDPAESTECFLAYARDGSSLWLSRAGKGYYERPGSSGVFDTILPSPQSVVVDLALSGAVALVAWQEDFFPNLGASGIIVRALP